MPAFP